MRLDGFIGALICGVGPEAAWDAGRVGITEYLGLPGTVEAARPNSAFVGPGQGMARWGQAGRRLAWRTTEEGVRGALSTVAPVSPVSMSHGAGGAAAKAIGRSAARGSFLGTLGKVAGPAVGIAFGMGMTGYRLSTEARGQGLVGNLVTGANVVNQEMWSMAGFGIGGAVGGFVGTFLGGNTFIGAGVGSIVGGFVGSTVLGSTAGRITGAAIMAPYTSYKFLRDLGIRSRRLELGGKVSEGNSTRLAATMRQRALGEINRSGMNARSILGREASLVHLRS